MTELGTLKVFNNELFMFDNKAWINVNVAYEQGKKDRDKDWITHFGKMGIDVSNIAK